MSAPVDREEFEALKARIARLEARLGTPSPQAATPLFPCPACGKATQPEDAYCITCGAALAKKPPSPAPAPTRAPAVLTPVTPAPTPRAAPARPSATFETLVGQRLAPRIGAALVFLATLFFLGVGIQRGWITPLIQLGIATATALALLGIAQVLVRRKGYGTYPQVLEGTAASLLYATTFAAYALDYYNAHTRLTELGGGLLLAMVAALTISLALVRDARVIASLGYGLSFLTAGLGWGTLPDLTLPYVAILGASLAFVAMWKRWSDVALLGTVATGVFFAFFTVDAWTPPPNAWLVTLGALVPAAAFVTLTFRAPRTTDRSYELGLVASLTLAWAAFAALAATAGETRPMGLVLFASAAASAALAAAAGKFGAARGVPLGYGVIAVILYLVAAPFAFDDAPNSGFANTATYALGALALLAVTRVVAAERAKRAIWNAALWLAGAAAVRAVLLDDRLRLSLDAAGPALGPWQAWATFALLFPALALLFATAPRSEGTTPRLVFAVGILYLGLWGFALFQSPFLTTAYLALAGGALAAAALARPTTSLSGDALAAGILFVALAAIKTASLDAHAVEPAMSWWLAGIETALVVATLLALHHVGAARGLDADPRSTALAFIGGAAVVAGSYVFAYAQGAWTSILLGAIGVASLAAGFALRQHAAYRYVAFGVLGFVLLRIFAVDLRETDLVVRAIVFAVLGLILLGVGYAYAGAARKNAAGPDKPS